MENTELKKHLVSVIDEAIAEIEELKKSKFAAQEIKIEGPGKDGIDGKPSNGSLGKDEDSDKDEDDEDEKEDEKEDAEKADCDDAEKADSEDADEDEKKKKEKESKNKKEDSDSDKKEMPDLKKSMEAQETLMKSYVDEKFGALDSKIASILESVRALADSPAPSKGVTVDRFAALQKSTEEIEVKPLNKSFVADALFELKKSRTQHVDSADIIKVETGNQNDVQTVAKKYGLVK